MGMIPVFEVAMRLTGGDSGIVQWIAGLAGAGVGATVSIGVHLAKSQIRLGSTAMTAGVGNPVLSIAEDVITVAGTLVSILLPLIALALTLLAAVLFMLFMTRRKTPAHERS